MTTGAEAALSEFRRTRRRRYVEDLDVMEILYRVYLVLIFGGIALAVIAGIVSEAPVSASALEDVRAQAPPIIGIAVGLAILAGLRSGANGGPLAIEPAEVQYTLLAPLNRGAALRPAAFSQLRIAAIAGAAVGAIVGNFVFRRFPGSGLEWIGCLALFGALVPVCVLGGALLGSGRRLRPWLRPWAERAWSSGRPPTWRSARPHRRPRCSASWRRCPSSTAPGSCWRAPGSRSLSP